MYKHLFHNIYKNNAFTLVEISIVIVIIALIIAGVSAGKNLVKQVQLQSVISDINKYKSAYNSFKMQYNAMPGDITNASSYWGTNCDSTPSNCNGNGNRQIATTTWNTGGATHHESFRAWQHLSLSGLINGSYSGIGDTNGSSYLIIPGVNAPKTSIQNGAYFFRYDDKVTSESGTTYTYTNMLFIGAKGAATGMANHSLFSPKEAYFIDNKIDDGKPDTGKVYGTYDATVSSICTTGTNPNGRYNLSNSSVACIMEVIP